MEVAICCLPSLGLASRDWRTAGRQWNFQRSLPVVSSSAMASPSPGAENTMPPAVERMPAHDGNASGYSHFDVLAVGSMALMAAPAAARASFKTDFSSSVRSLLVDRTNSCLGFE